MKKIMLFALCVLVLETNLFAQQKTSDDPIGKVFFPPELVMQNQQTINLTEAQRNSIIKEIQNAQSEFMTLQWDLQKEVEKLKSLVEKEKPAGRVHRVLCPSLVSKTDLDLLRRRILITGSHSDGQEKVRYLSQ